MKIAKAAAYLVGHGPYREPRLLDLQYFRIRRYASALEELLESHIDIVGIYADINYPRREGSLDLNDFPQLKLLLKAFANSEFEIVLVDLEIGRAFDPYAWYPLMNTFEQQKIPVYNAHNDDKDALSKSIEKTLR